MAGQLIERGPRKWLVRVYVGRDANGKRKYLNKTVHGNKKEAQAVLNRMLTEKDSGALREKSRQPFGDYLQDWLQTAAKQRLRETTFRDYQSKIRLYVTTELAATPLSKVSALDLQKLYSDMMEEPRSLSPRTVRYLHAILNSALSQAVKWGMLQANPAAAVELPRQPRSQTRVLTIEQAQQFLAACETDPLGPLFLLAVTAGLRPSEYLTLKWDDLDWKAGAISVVRTLPRQGVKDGKWSFEDTKRSRSRRTVKLQEHVLKALKAHKSKQAEARLKAGPRWENHGLIFTTGHGSPLYDRNVVRRLKAMLKRSGLPDVTLYALRHTAATLALAAGVPAKVVSEQLGHASTAFTMDTYAHVLPSMQDEAAARVEALLLGTQNRTQDSEAK